MLVISMLVTDTSADIGDKCIDDRNSVGDKFGHFDSLYLMSVGGKCQQVLATTMSANSGTNICT